MPKSTIPGNAQASVFCSLSLLSFHHFGHVKYSLLKFQICLFLKMNGVTAYQNLPLAYMKPSKRKNRRTLHF